MELAALSPRSSASSATSCSSRDSRASRHRRDRRHRHRHEPSDEEDADNRRSSRQRRGHTSSNLTDKSVQSSRGSSHRSSDEFSMASTCDGRLRVNLPLDREFLPLDKATQDEQEQVRDQVICMIFDLPESTQFYQDFSCAIASTLAMHGRMYPTSSHVCFYSNVFGRERKVGVDLQGYTRGALLALVGLAPRLCPMAASFSGSRRGVAMDMFMILIPYESIREIEKTTTMVFQHSIRLATFGKDEYTFTSFWGTNRDSCYDLIQKTRDRVLRELRPTVVNATESRYPALPTSPDSSKAASPAASPPLSKSNPAETEDEDVEDDNEGAAGAEVEDDDQTVSVTPRRTSVVSDVDSIAPKDISMTQILEESFPVSVKAFMQLFYLDNAPFGLDKFNEQTGSTEMTINPWMTPLEEEKSFGMTRSLQFRVPIDAPIGPKSSQVDVLQCLKQAKHGMRVVESSTRLVDIPYGDYFSVEDRWSIVPHSSNPNACKLFIEMKVVFGKSTFWKNTIEARAINDNRVKWEKWVKMAKEFLETRELNDAATCVIESPPTSSTSSEKAIKHSHGSMARRRSRSKANHQHRPSTATAMPSAATQDGAVKVFPWVLVLVLLLVILRLQMTLSSIEHSLLLNTGLIGELQQQLAELNQLQGCPAGA